MIYCVEWDVKLYYTIPVTLADVCSLTSGLLVNLFGANIRAGNDCERQTKPVQREPAITSLSTGPRTMMTLPRSYAV